MAMAENIVMSEMTWTEVDEAIKERPVALLPVGAVEAHGPHLPVSTDTVIAIEMAQRGAEKLKEHGIPSLILPPVYFTVADFGADFAGTLSIPPETATALLRDVCIAAAKRFRCVAPRQHPPGAGAHRVPEEGASRRPTRRAPAACYADITQEALGRADGPGFQLGDHAGAWETSLMMAAAPDDGARARADQPAADRRPDARPQEGRQDLRRGRRRGRLLRRPDRRLRRGRRGLLRGRWARSCRVSVMEHLGSKA